ncbi:MAG: asparagine synthase (glutamine-hydrolyzing) [Lysobacterales bacterium]
MCGIAGFTGPPDPATLERMADALIHRGPDDAGYFHDTELGVSLAHRRLSILDLAGGHQPMATADGALVVVFNGEIYNFAELRRELERDGAVFRTDHSDTEVLLHGYRRWGAGLPARLDGMWAFAILDRPHRRLFLSRDRFGEKPLYWHFVHGRFAFASELSALRCHPDVPVRVSMRALRKYFGYGFVPAPLAFIDGVAKLPAGHSLILDLASEAAPRVERHWAYRPQPVAVTSPADEANRVDEFRALLDAAVARRLVADVPVGCFLSGGIDSSTVTALAVRHAGRERIKAFTIGFAEATFDESDYAREVATHVGAEHRVDTLTGDAALALLPRLTAGLDEPVADSSLLPTFALCGHARREVTVALGGEGADELLAGYDPFRALRLAARYERWVPRPVHRAVALVAARLPVSHRYMSLDFRIKRTLRGVHVPASLRLPLWMAPLGITDLRELFGTPVDPEDLYSEAIAAFDECPVDDPVERAIAFYVRLYFQDDILAKADRMSMLHSLEVRAPFLDRDLVAFLERLPASLKFRGGRGKWILRQAARSLLPARILARRKQGFALPIGRWFADGVLPEPDPARVFNPVFWQRRVATHRSHRADERLYLWGEWLRTASPVGGLPAA